MRSLLDPSAAAVPYGERAWLGTVGGQRAVVVDATGSDRAVDRYAFERALAVARDTGAAVVVAADGTSAGEPADGWVHLGALARLSGKLPLAGVACGSVAGGRALALALCDYVVAVRDAEGVDPDARVAGRDEAADAVRAYLRLALARDRRFTAGEPDVAAGLRAIVPANARRAFDGRRLVALVLDPDSELPLRGAGPLLTSLGRIRGRSVGVVASQPMVLAGAIDAPAADRLARFVALCDALALPLVFLVDTPGLMAGPAAEASGMLRHSNRILFALANARTPLLTVIVRRAYGQGMYLLGSRQLGAALHVMWPTGEIGGMGLGGAATIVTRSAAETRTHAEVHAALRTAPEELAARFHTDAVIDPGATRERLAAALAQLPTTMPGSDRPVPPC